MSRLKRYARSLISGYIQLASNAIFSLATVPLALSYLDGAEFGLWATSIQLGAYAALMDLGMAAFSRVLVDHKDDKTTGQYGTVVSTLTVVSLIQAALIVLVGFVLGFGLSHLLLNPEDLPRLRDQFATIVFFQCVLVAATFIGRIFLFLLAAHQRHDVHNYASSFSFLTNYLVLWFAFAQGAGVYSLLWGQAAGWLCTTAVTVPACLRLHLFPPAGAWGRPSWTCFMSMFGFARDVFLYALGHLLLNASQTILIARVLGMEAAGVWAVCTRAFQLVSQIIQRVWDFSAPAWAEMLVRGEHERVLARFRSIGVFTGSASVLAGLLFAVCNQPFVDLYQPLKVYRPGLTGWSAWNDLALAAWLVLTAANRCHHGLIGQTKIFRMLRYIGFVEGGFFVLLSLSIMPWAGITGMLVAASLSCLLFSLPYGIWRTSKFFQMPFLLVLDQWYRPAARTALFLTPAAALIWYLSSDWTLLVQLITRATLLGGLGALIVLWQGLDQPLRDELHPKARRFLKLRWLSSKS